jgi:hypothetical protein
MYSFLRCCVVAVVVVFLALCTTEGVPHVNSATVSKMQSVPPSMARLVIYREERYLGSLLSPTVTVNGKELVNVGNGRVFVGAFRPGHYVFESNDKNSGTEIDLKPGSSIFIKMEIVAGMWKGNGRLLQVAPEQGAFEAKRLKPVDLNDIENPSYR